MAKWHPTSFIKWKKDNAEISFWNFSCKKLEKNEINATTLKTAFWQVFKCDETDRRAEYKKLFHLMEWRALDFSVRIMILRVLNCDKAVLFNKPFRVFLFSMKKLNMLTNLFSLEIRRWLNKRTWTWALEFSDGN
jgi:hypothetical protein